VLQDAGAAIVYCSEASMIEDWKLTFTKSLLATRVFELIERRAVNPRTGQELPFFVFDSVHWVNVVPLLDEQRVLMVRQFRQGTRAVTLEIPGGMVNRGEDPEVGARRELLEETGYEADELELIGVVDSNPAIQTNSTYTYIARGLRRVAELDQDDAEDIEVVEVPFADLDRLVRDKQITHSLVIAALYWLDHRRDLPGRLRATFEELSQGQTERVAALAKRLNQRLTPEDLRNPQDFPELAADPDFNYQDGYLAGIEAARLAVLRLIGEL
jgi:ADP-ribose pyrophosphatase